MTHTTSFCGQCGQSLSASAAFCPACGGPTQAEAPSSPVGPVPAPQPHARTAALPWALGALTILIVVGAASLIGAKLLRPEPAATKPPAAIPTAVTTSAVAPEENLRPSDAEAQNPLSDSPIRTVAAGTPERKELMNAARAQLDESRQFIVGQLKIQDRYAIAELTPQGSNQTWMVAFERSAGSWEGIWHGKSGGEEALTAEHPALPSTLLDAIVWSQLPTDGPTDREVETAAKRFAFGNSGIPESAISASLNRKAVGPDGTWWVVANADSEGNDTLTLVMHQAAGTRVLVLDDLGTAIVDDKPQYMPQSVWEQLCR